MTNSDLQSLMQYIGEIEPGKGGGGGGTPMKRLG